jgi:hypothetical protein
MRLQPSMFALALALGAGCGDSSIRIAVTVPTDYRGALKIYQRDPGGITPEFQNRTVELVFGSDGILRLKGYSPSQRWHTMSARYADGRPILVITNTQTTPPLTFGLWPVGGVRDNQDWYVIGTLDDVKRARELRDGFKWPPESPH